MKYFKVSTIDSNDTDLDNRHIDFKDFKKYLIQGKFGEIIEFISNLDSTLEPGQDHLIQTFNFLERNEERKDFGLLGGYDMAIRNFDNIMNYTDTGYISDIIASAGKGYALHKLGKEDKAAKYFAKIDIFNIDTFKKNDISIEYPNSWKKEENVSKYNLVIFSPSIPLNSYSALISLNKHEFQNTSNTNPQKIFDRYSYELINNIIKNKFNITKFTDNTISGSPAYELNFNDNNERIVSVLWTYKHDSIYSIIFIANKESYTFYESIFRHMIFTFKVVDDI